MAKDKLLGLRKFYLTILAFLLIAAMFLLVFFFARALFTTTLVLAFLGAIGGVYLLYTTANFLSKIAISKGQIVAEFNHDKGAKDAEVAKVPTVVPGCPGGAMLGSSEVDSSVPQTPSQPGQP